MKISGRGVAVGALVGTILYVLVSIGLGVRNMPILSMAIGYGAAVGAIAGSLQTMNKGIIVGFVLAAFPFCAWQIGFSVLVLGPNFGFDQIAKTPLLGVLREPLLFGLAGALAGATGVFFCQTKNTQTPVQRNILDPE